MALPNGDLITTVFDPQMAYPVDKRMQVDTLNSRDSISMFIRWEGMTVYVLEDSKIYILQGGRSNEFWKELGTGSGTGGTTFVGQFATANLLPTTGRSAGDYAFVGTGDDFVQYNWDNISGQWFMAEGQTDMASEFFHIGYKTPLRRPVIFPLLPKDVLVETSGDFVFAHETAVARFIFTGEVTAIRGIETAAADREIKLVNRTGSDIPLRDKASGIPSGSGMDFGGSDYTWVNGSEITLKGNGTYWELAPNNQIAFSDHLDSVNAKVSVGSDGLKIIYGIQDKNTGESLVFKKYPSIPILIDGVIFIQYEGEYFKRVTSENIISIDSFAINAKSGIVTSSESVLAITMSSITGLNLIFPKREYLIGKTTLSNLDNINIDFCGSTISYSGPDISTCRQFEINNCNNINIRNAFAKGPMFNGIDKNNIPSENKYTNNYAVNSVFIRMDGCSDVELSNMRSIDTVTSFLIYNSNRLILNNLRSEDVYTSFRIDNSNDIRIANCYSVNAKYDLFSNTYGTDPTEYYIGANGSGFLFNTCTDVRVEDSRAEQSGTNSFRVDQSCRDVTFSRCVAKNPRRHGFSVYGLAASGSGSKNILCISCFVYDVSNPLVWTGSDTVNTFNRPHSSSSPASFVCSQENNELELVDSGSYSATYHDVTPPTVDAGAFNAKYANSLVEVYSSCKVKVNNCYFEGYTRIRAFDIQGNGSVLRNSTIVGNKLIAESAETEQLTLAIYADDCEIEGNTIKNGSSSIYINSSNIGNVVKGNKCFDPYRYGLNIKGSNQTVDSNVVTYTGVPFSSGGRSIYISANNSEIINNSVVDRTGSMVLAGWMRALASATGNTYKNNIYPSYNESFRRDAGSNFSLDVRPFDADILGIERKTLTAGRTLNNTDVLLVFNRPSGSSIVTLPTDNSIITNKIFIIKNIGAAPVITEGGLVDGQTSITINQYESATLVYDGSNYIDLIKKGTFVVPNASTTQRGIIEQATDAETITGTDTERSVSPANLQAKLNALILSATATLDFPTIAAGETERLTATVTGAALLDPVVVSGPDNIYNSNNSTIDAWVSAANTVTVRVRNNGASSIDPGEGQFKIKVFK